MGLVRLTYIHLRLSGASGYGYAIERDFYDKGKQREALEELMEHDEENGLYGE